MRRKTFLYGLGSGLIAGALLVQLGNIGEMAKRPLDQLPIQEMTREQFRSMAEKYGYGLYDANTSVLTQEEAEHLVQEAAEKARAEALEEAEGDRSSNTTVYAFTIAPGSTLQQVALLLEAIGFVQDADSFMNNMKAQGLSSRIRAGAYRFDEVPAFDELAEKLTTPQ